VGFVVSVNTRTHTHTHTHTHTQRLAHTLARNNPHMLFKLRVIAYRAQPQLCACPEDADGNLAAVCCHHFVKRSHGGLRGRCSSACKRMLAYVSTAVFVIKRTNVAGISYGCG